MGLLGALGRVAVQAPGSAHWLTRAPFTGSRRVRCFLAEHDVYPDVVLVDPRDLGVKSTFEMLVGQPRDQVVTQVWRDGFASVEQPLPSIVAALARARCEPSVVVGANSGFYAFLLAAAHGASVTAYEPLPDAVERLASNIRMNPHLEPLIQVREAAVSDAIGTARLYVPLPLAEGWPLETSASLDATFKSQHSGEELTVGVVTLDSEISECGLLLTDAEGVDVQALRGARGLIRRSRPEMIVEMSELDLEALSELMDELDLTAAQLTEHGISWMPKLTKPMRTTPFTGSDRRAVFWQVLLIPSERVDWARAVLTEVGISTD